MAVLSLPLSFTNSFWSQDYRRGLEIIFAKLQQGVAENEEIIAFVRARALAEANLAAALSQSAQPGLDTHGFAADDGATLLMAFRGLQAETDKQAGVHKNIAQELNALVADPFVEWAKGHRDRLNAAQNTLIEGHIRAYESSAAEVLKLKNQYINKVRKADEAEDDAKFAPGSEVGSDKYTTSPRLQPVDMPSGDGRPAPQRGFSVSERIAQRLRDIQKKTATATGADNGEKEALLEKGKVDKGKERAVDEHPIPDESASPLPMSPLLPPKLEIQTPGSPMPPMPPSPMLLAGLSVPPSAVSDLLRRAQSELPLRPVRFPLLGEYPDCFTGEEFATWLRDNVDGLGGSWDKAEDAAKDLTEREGLLRRIGEFRNFFEPSDEAFYQFRPKAFELGRPSAVHQSTLDSVASPLKITQGADDLFKRSNKFLNVVSKALTNDKEPPHVRARIEAEAADRTYRIAIRKLDRQRLGLEERIEEALKNLQRMEMDRLRAVKTLLLQFHGTLSNLPKALEGPLELSGSHIAAYIPETDLNALIERYRTGPFRPAPQLYESIAHDEPDVVFGIDLRKWADGGWGTLAGTEEKKELVHPVLTALLTALVQSYAKLSNDEERRKAWIYEVPLRAVHHAREALNGSDLDLPIPPDLLTKYDAPVLASTIKLWLLELDPPLAMWDGWDEIRKIYPSVGSSKSVPTGEEHQEALRAVLQRFPKVHLYALDALITHIRALIENTNSNEENQVYIAKLSLSLGRTILRPKHESPVALQDRHPAMFFIDLVDLYKDLIPPVIAKKKNETERRMPIRKRTAPVDLRMSRSRMSVGTEARDWLAQQRLSGKIPAPVPPVPKLATPVPPAASTTSAESAPIPAPKEPEPKSASEAVSSPSRSEPSAASPAQESPSAPAPPVAQPASPPAKPTSPNVPAPPAFKEPAPEVEDQPSRPSFREPSPEKDDQPPRPSFREPPPEPDDQPPRPPAFREPDLSDVTPVPRPNFAEPPPETEDEPARDPSVFSSRQGSLSPTRSGSPRLTVKSPISPTSERSPSPLRNQDAPLSTGKANLGRSGSNEGASRAIRGPRGSRPPRTGGGGSVSQMVSSLNNRQSVTEAPRSPRRPLSAVSDNKRSSLTGTRGSLARRTMDSDAEDNVVQ
ncbi:hypothetical protein PENSPDRAFT_734057 [Peniophora sp. CONT]|nr:hypothetical protein PENSPDRAFT_734057 [Peniophora sp. CONT]